MLKSAFVSFLLIPITIALSAQIKSVGALQSIAVGGDSVFLYTNLDKAQLVAHAESSTDIEWFSFDENMKNFSTLLRKVTAQSDTMKITSNGGIMVRIGSSEYHCWFFVANMNTVTFEIDTICCEYMKVTSAVNYDTLRVFDMSKTQYIDVPQKVSYEWLLNDSTLIKTNQTSVELDSPYEDGELKVVATNQIGSQVEASDTIMAFGVKAAFTYEARERSVDNEISKGDALSAPAEVEFKNLSKGTYNVCEWVMGSISRQYETNPVYSFQKSGTYDIKLIITNSDTGCSSADSSAQIIVTEAALEFPNVFTPNGDGVNDEFRPAYKSLKSYNITIYNRWGRKVYSSSDPTIGWDGKEGNAKAAEGVYMYVAEAEGYDKGVSFKRKGSVTLIR